MDSQKEKYIHDMIKAEGVSKNTAKFFIKFLDHFLTSDPIISTSKKLGLVFECSDRTIQRYIKELKEEYSYIHVKPKWNNDNPDRSYIETNTYSRTDLTLRLESRAEAFSDRDKNVNFRKGLF